MDQRQKSTRLLSGVFGEREAHAIVRLLFESLFGMGQTEMLTGGAERLTESEARRLDQCVARICNGEPVQYVIGTADFMDMKLKVTPAVLIPRPETEDLVRIIIETTASKENLRMLDIGTGSGCIAISLKSAFPNSHVCGCDISSDALAVARKNAESLGQNVDFQLCDILKTAHVHQLGSEYDIIVSNPPYVCDSESAEMGRHVVEHEPHQALFVGDDAPLTFYEAIVSFASKSMKVAGRLYFEVNRRYAYEVAHLLETFGFSEVTVAKDRFGNDRIVYGTKLKER